MRTFSEHHCSIYIPVTGQTDRPSPEGTSAPRPLQSALLHCVANIILPGKALPFEVHFGFAPQTYLPSSPQVGNLLRLLLPVLSCRMERKRKRKREAP